MAPSRTVSRAADRAVLAIAPKQARGRAAQERIVAATLALLEEQPFERIGVAHIAARARVAVGNVYRRFVSKERLLVFVAREVMLPEVMAELRAELEPSRWHGKPITD